MSELSDSVEKVWKGVYETSIGANCVSARQSHNNHHLNLYVCREGNTSIIEIPDTPLYCDQSNNPQLAEVYA